MNIKVSDSFKSLMSRVDCKIIISEAWLGETDQGFTPVKNSLIQIPANGIWEEENNILKVLVIIPDEHIVDSDDQRQEYGAIYFFSSTNSDEPAFIIYDLDEPLSLGRNLINIEFSDIKASIKMIDTSDDTIFLETFGQNPGKNIYLTGNESSLVSKNTYYVFWRVGTTDDDTTDLPILDSNGKLVAENYTYKTYSNLRIGCPGLTKTCIPHARYGLSDDGGVVPITGIADFIEYKVTGGTIKETLRGEITIEDIPGSEIVYISGHNDLGQPVSEPFNIFTPNNYLSMIEYKRNDYPGSYGADGIFGLRIRYYDVREQKPVILDSVNQIKLVRRDVADDWFILDKSSRFLEDTEDYGEVPVFMFPYDTSGSEYLIIRTKLLNPITDVSQITVTSENEILDDLFKVDLSLSSFTDENGTYFVDIMVRLSALTTNTDPINWAPIVNGVSTLFYTKISYEDYFSIIYLVQKPNIEGSLKLVDLSGNIINQVRMADYEVSKSYYLITDPEEDPATDFDNRPAWKVIEYPTGISFAKDNGYLSPEVKPSYSPENRIIINYPTRSTTAQNIHLSDIKIARIKESGIPEDLMTTTNWRLLVDIAQINVGFMKYGRNINFSTFPVSMNTSGIGLYELIIRSNCRYTLSSADSGIYFRNLGSSSYSNTLDSPSYYDNRYSNGGDFGQWIQMHVVVETAPTTRGPITITATEEDRTVTRDVIIDQSLVSDNIYKLRPDGEPYSNGTWGYTMKPEKLPTPYEKYAWVKRYARNSTSSLDVSAFNSNTLYSPGDIVKYSVNVNAPVWNPTGTYGSGQMVYHNGNWWVKLETNYLNPEPSFNNSNWRCDNKYFICLRQFTTNILGDPTTTPLEVNSLNLSYIVHTAYWQELAAVDDFDELKVRSTSVHSAPMYDPGRVYDCGDMVRYGATPVSSSAYNSATHYQIGDEVLIGSSDPYECYRCIGYNNSGYLVNVQPGVDENWQLYWRYFDPYTGYICTKGVRAISPSDTDGINYWSTMSSDFIELPRNKRLIAIRSKERVYMFMEMGLGISSGNTILTPEDVRNEINNNLGDEHTEDINFVLEHPVLYKTGLSLKFWNSISISSIGSPGNSITSGNFQAYGDLYLFVERDNTWVEVEDLDTLSSILGDGFYDSYFRTSGRQLIMEDYNDKINYSYLIAPDNMRSVYAIQDCIISSSLEEIVEQTEKQELSCLFPYYSSYSNLPGLDSIVRDKMKRFFNVVCRISDGGKIRAAIINPSISGYFRPVYPDLGDPVLSYQGEWKSNNTYSFGDTVYYSNLGKSRLYYWCADDNNGNGIQGINPTTDTSGKWECITWTNLPATILTDEDAIETVIGPSYLNLNSTREVGVRGRFNYGTTLFDATRQITDTEPKLGDIIQIGTTYYYCSLWTVVDVPTTQADVDSLITIISPYEGSQPFIKNQDYFLCKGFSNVLIKNPQGDGEYYYLNSRYIFNNIGSNKYIFIPEYSMDYTIVKYYTRKTPTETLYQTTTITSDSTAQNSSVYISQATTPEFSEENQNNNHYTDHYTGISLSSSLPTRAYIPQVQTEYEGYLTLANSVNQSVATPILPSVTDIFGRLNTSISFSDLRLDTTKINYYLYKEPYYPFIKLYKNGREITTINLENFYSSLNISGCTTIIEVVSPYPVSVSNLVLSSVSSNTSNFINISTRRGFTYTMSYPRIERDGYYHYTLSLTPTSNNDGIDATPVKLGDLNFMSRIRKNGTKPTEWVIVEDSSTGIEILKKVLRTEDVEIFDLDSNNSGGIRLAFLPKLEEAIPGLVYRGRSNAIINNSSSSTIISSATLIQSSGSSSQTTRLYVAVPYDFVKDDTTNSIDKYYYSQEEIDREYGVYIKRVSIIQKSSYEFELLGEKTNDIDFLGETRTYELSVRGTGWSGDYVIGNEENCTITNNSSTNEITMTVPSRIQNYRPKLISDPYYVELKDKLPVSFDILVNAVDSGNIDKAGDSMQLSGSSMSSTYLDLESKPSQGTSGLQNVSNTYYRDEYSGVGKFIRTIERYKYFRKNSQNLIGTGYNYQRTEWESFSGVQDQSRLLEKISEHNTKYGDSVSVSTLYGLSGMDANNSPISLENNLPVNIDDIIGFGYYDTDTPSSGDVIIKVDSTNFPQLARFGAFYTSDNLTYKKFRPCKENKTTYPNHADLFYIGKPEWRSVDSIEEAYVDLGIATEFMWKEVVGNPILVGYDTTPINLTIPIATINNFGSSFWYWKKISEYSSSTIYNVGDLVMLTSGSSHSLWRCLENSVSGVSPSGSASEWEEITTASFDETYSSDSNTNRLPRVIGNGGDVLTKYFVIGSDCYKAVNVVCTTKPIYGLIAIKDPGTSLGITQIDNPGYSYYRIDRFPLGTSWRNLTGIYTVDENSQEYARKTIPFFITGGVNSYNYYRKQVSVSASDLYNSTTSEIYEGRIFKINYGGGYKYFQLKKNPEELLAPVNYSGSMTGLGDSKYPGNLFLVGDASESGYGVSSGGFPGVLMMDFNDFSYKVQSFEEKISLLQKRATRGIISNFGEFSKEDYRLYFGDFPQKNTITITVDPEVTEVSGMIGIFNTTSPLTPDSGLTGVLPSYTIISSPGCNITSNQLLPRLDGGQSDNFIITFDPNNGDQDLIHDLEFYTSEDGFNTRVYLRVIQKSDPGEVVVLGSSNLFFLSNGLLQNTRNFGFLDFNSTININLNNIEILNDNGEDILDRGDEDNIVSYVNPISVTNGSVRYRAFLKLKPNTTNQLLNNFRIKIGKITGNTVTDRTIIGDGRFYEYTENGWSLLGSEYTPSYLEKYVTVLPTSADLGDIVCVCNSLRGSQGYYSVALFNPRKTNNFNNATGLEYRSASTGVEISDLRSALGIDEGVNLDNIATIVSELPDINQEKQSGLLYKIGGTYYYTYADFITSGFTYGTPDIPIEIDSVGENDQKFHLKVTQVEYDSIGNTTTTELTSTIFNMASNYRLSYATELYSGVNENSINRIYEGDEELYFLPPEIIYASTNLPGLVPYLKTTYNFSEQADQASIITIKTTITIKLGYNYSGPNIPQEYREIENKFTLYIRKE